MHVWDKERFNRLESRIIATLEGKRPEVDVPFYRYLYSPDQEVMSIREFKKLRDRIKAKGYSSDCVYMSNIFIKSMDKLGLYSEKNLPSERGNREIISEDLERELPVLISEELITLLTNKDLAYCGILLRTGVLFPFVHISSILSKLEGHIRCCLVIPYPGNKEGEMLNYRGESVKSYYRGEVY